MDISVYLPRGMFQPVHQPLVRVGRLNMLSAEIGLSASGIHIVRLSNHEGSVEILPYVGAAIWDAHFYGVRLGRKRNEPLDSSADPGL